MNEVVLVYPTYVERAIWTSSPQKGLPINDEISFQSAEGLRFTSEGNLSYQLTDARVPKFYVKFGSDDLNSLHTGSSATPDLTPSAFRLHIMPKRSMAPNRPN